MIAEIENTTEMCPSQWEGRLKDGTYFYVRYRSAWIRIGFGATLEEATDKAIYLRPNEPYGRGSYQHKREDVDPLDGYMTWEEMEPYFLEAENYRHQDNCSICYGRRGGVRGNENIIGGALVCDYCHVDIIDERRKHS